MRLFEKLLAFFRRMALWMAVRPHPNRILGDRHLPIAQPVTGDVDTAWYVWDSPFYPYL